MYSHAFLFLAWSWIFNKNDVKFVVLPEGDNKT